MRLAASRWDLLRYKVRHVGLLATARVAYLDVLEEALSRIGKRFPAVAASPRSIQIECTTRCNLKCTFCELSYWTEKPADLQVQDIRKIVDDLPKLRRVDLTGIGEALMNREFFTIVELLKSRGIYVTLNDNFTLMTESAARRIVELGVDQIFLSLDGATKETFETLRRGASFDKVMGNARRLVAIRREARKRRPELKINSVVCRSNYQEMPALVELAHDVGVGMVQFVNVVTFDDTTALGTAGLAADLRKTFDDAARLARRLGIVVKIELFDKRPVERCDFPWKRNFVTRDGYLHPCCYTTQSGDRAAQNGRSFGNLLLRSFRDLWTSDAYESFRTKMARGILPSQCEHCPKYVGVRDDETSGVASRVP